MRTSSQASPAPTGPGAARADLLEILWFGTSRCSSGSRRAAGDGLRSGPGDPEPNDGPAARFAAEAARYETGAEPAFRSEQASLRWAAQRPPAILIRTAILTARIAGYTPGSPTVCVALATTDLVGAPARLRIRRRGVSIRTYSLSGPLPHLGLALVLKAATTA